MRSNRAGGAKNSMSKKIIFLFILAGFLLLPAVSSAEGLVPCGGEGEDPCTLCHFFVLLENIIDFVFINLVPPVAMLMLAIGGFMFFFAGGDPGNLARAKSIITTTVLGLVIVYLSFIVIGIFLLSIGLADWTKNIYSSWWSDGFFEISCETGP